MAANIFTRYALDPTGKNPDNLILGEVKTLTTSATRAAAPKYGPYFSESMVIYDHGTNRKLDRGIDYDLVDLVQEATLEYGHEIMQVILIRNPSVTNQIRYSYQVLGGLYQNNSEGIIALYDSLVGEGRPVDWSLIFNKPLQYPSTAHLHLLSEIVGFGPVVQALNDIRDAIVLSNVPAFESLIDWVKMYAGSNVIFDPVVRSVKRNQTLKFNITTSKKPNNSKIFWTLLHHGTESDNFVTQSGPIPLFQNRGSFTVQTSNISPDVSRTFDIAIREDTLTGPILTIIEGITLIGLNVDPTGPDAKNTVAALMTSCCLMEPGIRINAKSLYITGDR